MSYIIKQLPSKSELISELKEFPERLSYYAKYDTFEGNSNAIKYIQKLLNK